MIHLTAIGLQSVELSVVKRNDTNLTLSVSWSMCADHVMEMCFIPCRRDCRLSDWTTWSECVVKSRRCGVGIRQRSRYLTEPNLDGGRDCPPLTDSEVPTQFGSKLEGYQYARWMILMFCYAFVIPVSPASLSDRKSAYIKCCIRYRL